jgi:hypothetical protein
VLKTRDDLNPQTAGAMTATVWKRIPQAERTFKRNIYKCLLMMIQADRVIAVIPELFDVTNVSTILLTTELTY